MEEIIGLLVVLAAGIFKAVNKKFEDAGKEKETSVPEGEPVVIKREPIAPRPVTPKPVAPKPQQRTFDLEDVQRQTKARKPMLIEEEETSPREKIDPKKLVLYSEIMNPKFNE